MNVHLPPSDALDLAKELGGRESAGEGPGNDVPDPAKYAQTRVAAWGTWWVTETGAEAAVGDTSALAKQQSYIGHVVDAMMCRPWWQRTIFYELTEEHPSWGLALRTSDPDATPVDDFQRTPPQSRRGGVIYRKPETPTPEPPTPGSPKPETPALEGL